MSGLVLVLVGMAMCTSAIGEPQSGDAIRYYPFALLAGMALWVGGRVGAWWHHG